MKTRLVLFISLFPLIFALQEAQVQQQFIQWVRTHAKSYDSNSFAARYQIFKDNLQFIEQHNSDPSRHRVAMNRFGDLTSEEFAAIYNGLRIDLTDFLPKLSAPVLEPIQADFPEKKDWRGHRAVTPVKNQEQCGSCWAFSATGAMEGCHALQTNELVSLSEKNLMDCSWDYGNLGCNGGLMTSAFAYVVNNGGIDTEESYPYVPESSLNCKYSPKNIGTTVKSYTEIQKGSEAALLRAVNATPVSVGIDASRRSFQFYTSGVYQDPECSSVFLDHGVLVVGWGVDQGKEYWLVKNSWGEEWGQDGYIWMAKNQNNHCGIASMASYPIGCYDP